MEHNQNKSISNNSIRGKLFTSRNLVLMAALVAMQIVLARFLSIQVSDTLRISFESIIWASPC